VPRLRMKKLDAIEKIERAETLFAELKAIARWNEEYGHCRDHKLWETVALVRRCSRRVEILSELVAIVSAMYCKKSNLRRRSPLTRKCGRRSFVRMA
jgi:hypothetical protein